MGAFKTISTNSSGISNRNRNEEEKKNKQTFSCLVDCPPHTAHESPLTADGFSWENNERKTFGRNSCKKWAHKTTFSD